MASTNQVRQYLAYWFQLGKKVMIHNGREAILPRPVIAGDRYSNEFEECWQRIQSPNSGDCYLEGSSQTISDLLSSAWEVDPCARCEMPVPVPTIGMPSLDCPCSDLPNWPDADKPQPRSPINSQNQLSQIRNRLMRAEQGADSTDIQVDQTSTR